MWYIAHEEIEAGLLNANMGLQPEENDRLELSILGQLGLDLCTIHMWDPSIVHPSKSAITSTARGGGGGEGGREGEEVPTAGFFLCLRPGSSPGIIIVKSVLAKFLQPEISSSRTVLPSAFGYLRGRRRTRVRGGEEEEEKEEYGSTKKNNALQKKKRQLQLPASPDAWLLG